MKIRRVKEGKTEFYVPEGKESKRGPSKKANGFYNPSMELSRDISILVVQWLVEVSKKPLNEVSKKPLKILDGLAASGARGVRIANEVEGNLEVIINDWKRDAYKLIEKNIQHNKLHAIPKCENVNKLLHENKFDYIDIDPYGTPVPYMDSAMKGIKNNGVIAVTATDTATLCGVYPKTCIRRYGAVPLHFWAMHEVGLRIIIGYICREAAKYDKSIEPLLSHATDHYMRVYVKVIKGARRADRCLENLKKVEIEDLESNKREVGPIWTGKLHNKVVLIELKKLLQQKELGTHRNIKKLLERALEEVDMPMLFYTVDALAKHFKVSPPKIDKIMKKLEIEGYRASRTHFSDNAFKTDAPRETVLKIFRELS